MDSRKKHAMLDLQKRGKPLGLPYQITQPLCRESPTVAYPTAV